MNCHPHRCVPVYVTAMVFLRRSTEIAKTLFSDYFVKQENSLTVRDFLAPIDLRLIGATVSSTSHDIHGPFQFVSTFILAWQSQLSWSSFQNGNTAKIQDSLCL